MQDLCSFARACRWWLNRPVPIVGLSASDTDIVDMTAIAAYAAEQ